ncbi:3-deoxy-manno-octulosonate cytidylyltransferase [Collinsella tanakaei]|nr:3-deoxy-manno-octulosonate cytidylyltransferase [Collinsella tanakaei]
MIAAIIPARFGSTRFPGKPLADICGKPMIQWVYERVSGSPSVDLVFVATDNNEICSAVREFGGKAMMTSSRHACGSDRIAECAKLLRLSNKDIVLNIQGDEPLISPEMVEELVSCFRYPGVVMGTLAKRIFDSRELDDPNVVKVVIDKNDNALMFSRSPIPFNRDGRGDVIYYKHVGAYGYRKGFLDQYSGMERGYLEQVESLEQLRVLENGHSIRVAQTSYEAIGVDTPEDLERVRAIVKEMNL